ncbi:MAG: hypothetical protein IIZ94_11990 [Prevotella sp.]|nr:hypothetical protein [Prevotella sp.]
MKVIVIKKSELPRFEADVWKDVSDIETDLGDLMHSKKATDLVITSKTYPKEISVQAAILSQLYDCPIALVVTADQSVEEWIRNRYDYQSTLWRLDRKYYQIYTDTAHAEITGSDEWIEIDNK